MNLEHIVANSYRNFHARGLDYLCLKRTPELTLKVYFFDGPQSHLDQLPEIVAPHDHRYDFHTTIVRGVVQNRIFRETKHYSPPDYQKFEWDTPLLGGKGFTHVGAVHLYEDPNTQPYAMGDTWFSPSTDVHTLRILERGSIILQRQYEDIVPVGTPTIMYMKGEPKAPSLSGLYDRMTEADAVARIEEFRKAYPAFDWKLVE